MLYFLLLLPLTNCANVGNNPAIYIDRISQEIQPSMDDGPVRSVGTFAYGCINSIFIKYIIGEMNERIYNSSCWEIIILHAGHCLGFYGFPGKQIGFLSNSPHS